MSTVVIYGWVVIIHNCAGLSESNRLLDAVKEKVLLSRRSVMKETTSWKCRKKKWSFYKFVRLRKVIVLGKEERSVAIQRSSSTMCTTGTLEISACCPVGSVQTREELWNNDCWNDYIHTIY